MDYMSALKNFFLNFLLVLCSGIAAFAFIGYFVIKSGLITQTPLKFHFALPPAIALLAQSSKAGTIPQNYVLIVGDSFAKGNGDWLLSADPDSNGPFHSAHVLHDLSGMDVISFGRPGSSSIKGWVREPSSLYPFVHNVIDDSFGPPDIVLAYFYAGNDPHENALQLQDDFVPEYGDPMQAGDAAWESYLLKQIKNHKVGPYRHINTTFGWLINASADVAKKSLRSSGNESIASVHDTNSTTKNRIMLQGVAADFNFGFLAPGLGLSRQQLERSFLAVSRSLHSLRLLFPGSKLVVVYVPSPAESYRLASDHITVMEPQDVKWDHMLTAEYPVEQLLQLSDETAERVKQIAVKEGASFVDTREDIRSASSGQLIHGPLDMTHFNQMGYTALAGSIACHLSEQKIWDKRICPLQR